jgi:hypothetical protein
MPSFPLLEEYNLAHLKASLAAEAAGKEVRISSRSGGTKGRLPTL